MNSPIDIIDQEALRNSLKTSYIGRSIYYYTSTVSTNIVAAELVKKGEAEGAVVIAEEQTGGRGRLDRKWVSAAGKNILISIIFRPEIKTSQLFYITMLCSTALVKAVKKISGIRAGIKWPNDIYIKNKKTAGILTEVEVSAAGKISLVVGIGVNVNFDPSLYAEISDTATSLSAEAGREFSRTAFLALILREIRKGYDLLKKGATGRLRRQWIKNSIVMGRQVRIISAGGVEEGIVETLEEDGSLILLNGSGARKRISSGDVSLRFNGR